MFPSLVIAGLPDLSLAPHIGLPALPALSELLRLADPAGVDPDWRGGLLRDLGAAEWSKDSPATIAAAALSLPVGTAVCLATPVHAVAGLNRVHLHAAGCLRFDPGHSAELAAELAAQFGDELRLHALAGGWLVEATWAAAASDGDPGSLLGMPLERSAAQSQEQRQLRRLGAELEMWLAGLPLNEERVRRGELPVNLLWLWGGGRVRELRKRPRSSLRLHAAQSDPWLAGCATLLGATVSPLPEGWGAVAQSQQAVIVLQATPTTDARQLLHWDEQWFAPLLCDLRARRIATLALRFGHRAMRVRRRLWSAPWRRSRPWWQAARA